MLAEVKVISDIFCIKKLRKKSSLCDVLDFTPEISQLKRGGMSNPPLKVLVVALESKRDPTIFTLSS